jgi:murein DD-endopeptidase MepM/ murein hydrolase activator NlpD
LVLLIVVTVVVLIAYTPAMDTIPGYPGRRSRQALIENILRLDSLEREMANLTVYSDNIDMIMEGKTPVIRDVVRMGDSIRAQDKTIVSPDAVDSLLRARMEGDGEWSLAASVASSRVGGAAPGLIPPVTGGIIQGEFSPVGGRFGVELAAAEGSPVVAIGDGNVILTVWTPEEGYVVGIQHSGDLVSIYRRLSESLPRIGARVRAGEIVGTAGTLIFELWNNGTPVDPANYIVF